jgi:Tfp pilus assembly protein PilF
MAANNENADRRVVPRWRTFADALATQEVAAAAIASVPTIETKPFVLEKERDWLTYKELPFAIDLVSAATLLGSSKTAADAAKFILREAPHENRIARALAAALLGLSQQELNASVGFPGESNILKGLALLKAKRVSQSRNAFVWVDLARLYVILGQNDAAWKALRVALSLAPSERFILRSTTRFLLHTHKAEQALKLLRVNPRTQYDPWLLAAEIAISSVLKKTPKFAKLGHKLFKNSDLKPFHMSELGCALGSLEMFEGADRKANKLFRASLEEPTDNALAQIVWASKRTGLGNIVEPELLVAPQVSEARAINAFNQFQWKDTVSYAENWADDEAFSARPRLLGSAISTTFLNDGERGERIARDGLATNPGHPGLINNIAFALIESGRPQQALLEFERVDKRLVTPQEAICLMATAGLASFRLGKIEEGREYYERAIQTATLHDKIALKIIARLYLAREEIRSGLEEGIRKFAAAKADAEKLQTTNLPAVADHLERELLEQQQAPLANALPASVETERLRLKI